ncbi:MAG: hypothetical protein RLZZ490_558 [Cyanobacteriota bacterium]
MLLGAYALAMWLFLTSAPKVYTIMVSDLAIARSFYEGLLELNVADVPLHYYYNYEQTLGTASWDTYSLAVNPQIPPSNRYSQQEGLWYQLKKNTQLHIIGGASLGDKNRQRHVCFDHDCLEQIFLRVQSRRLRYKVRRQKPLNFLVKDYDERVIELTEVKN